MWEQPNKCNRRRLTNMKFLAVLKRELRGIIIALKYNSEYIQKEY